MKKFVAAVFWILVCIVAACAALNPMVLQDRPAKALIK